jgi:hypothetical protein
MVAVRVHSKSIDDIKNMTKWSMIGCVTKSGTYHLQTVLHIRQTEEVLVDQAAGLVQTAPEPCVVAIPGAERALEEVEQVLGHLGLQFLP